jgi:dihydroflavonol-4-reductase
LADQERLVWLEGDILDAESLRRAFAGVEGVYHLAGKISLDGDPDGTVWKCNVEAAGLVAATARRARVSRLVHCASVQALRLEPTSRTLDERLLLCDGEKGRPLYDRSKAAGLLRVEEFGKNGLRVVSVLPSGVIGPHDAAPSRMGRVFLDLLHRRLPALTGGGFDFVDVRDVAAAMIAAMANDTPSARYVVGGQYVTIKELAARASAISGGLPPRFMAPVALARISAPLALAWSKRRGQEPLYTPDSIRTLQNGRPTDSTRAKRELGYRPRPLDETLRDIYASFREPSRILL